MLPYRLYESLPYLYMLLGVVVLLWLDNVLAAFSALLLITAGALVWILRSDHRRADLAKGIHRQGRWPFWFYELQPFVYASAGLLLWRFSSNMYFYPSAMILMVVGLQIWLMRGIHRQHQPAKTKLQK
jgi:hypothetical protein